MSARRAFSRRTVFLLVKIAVSVGLLVILFARTDLEALWARLHGTRLGWMAAALALYGAMVAVSAWRWRVLLDTQQVAVPLAKLGESFLVATFFNNFLPSNIGGDVVRITDTAPFTDSKTIAGAVVLIDRGLGLIALFLVAVCGSWVATTRGIAVPGARYLWVTLLAAIFLAGVVLMMPRLVPRLLSPLTALRPGWVEERLDRLAVTLARVRAEPGRLLTAFAGAILVQLILVVFYLAAARGLDVPLPVLYGAVVVPVSLAAQMIPVSINGFGVREAVFTYFFARLGLGTDAALALSLVSAGLIMLFSVSGGVLFLLRRGGIAGRATVR